MIEVLATALESWLGQRRTQTNVIYAGFFNLLFRTREMATAMVESESYEVAGVILRQKSDGRLYTVAKGEVRLITAGPTKTENHLGDVLNDV